MVGWKRKGWALYRTVSELLLSPKEGWRRMKWKMYAEVQRPEKRASSWEEGLSSLPEGEWAVAESQRGMTQDEVKIVCRGATPWKTGILLRGRVELFTGGWVSCCWVPKRDDAGWSENCMPRWNALKNQHLPERKGWAFTGGWVSSCWVPKRDGAGNEKNDCKTDEENRKGRYKHHVSYNLT